MTRASRPPRPPRPAGIAMLLVLVALALVTVLAMTFLAAQSTSIGIAENVRGQTQARMVAETALTQMVRYMRDTPNWRSERTSGVWVDNAALGGGTYTLSGIDPDGNLFNDPSQPLQMVVTGRYRGVSHTVRATVTPYIPVVRRLLMIVPNSAALDTQDQAKKALFESWGYVVTPLSDSASASTFTTQMQTMDVVFVACSASSGNVGAKLNSAAIGVVAELAGMHNRLTVAASSGSTYNDKQLTIVNNTHYITQPFPLGPLVLASSSLPLVRTSGALGADAVVLSNASGGAIANLVALDANGRLTDGTGAFGRRALLPFAGSGFDVRLLNKDGQTLLRRTLDWAAQPIVPRTPVAHWPLGEVSGGVAYDVAGTNHGDYEGGVWLGLPGPMGNAASFDGQNDCVLVPHAAVLNVRNAITVTAWVWANTWDNGNHRVLQKGLADNQYRLTAEWGLFKWDLAGVGTLTAALPATGRWVHVAACYDGARMSLYYDGQLVAAGNASGTLAATNDPLLIATKKVGAPASDSFGGLLCDVQLFDYGLNASEVHHLVAQGTVDDQNPKPKLVALYEFKETVEQPVLLHNWKLDENGGGGGLAAGNQVRVSNQAVVLSYDSTLGPCSATNLSAAAALSTNSTASGKLALDTYGNLSGDAFCGPGGIPATAISVTGQAYVSGVRAAMASAVSVAIVNAPTGMPATLGNQTIGADTVLNGDRRYNNLTIQGQATVTVSGNLRVLCDGDLSLSGAAQLVIPPGSSLSLYVVGNLTLTGQTALNPDSSAVSRLKLYHISASSGKVVTLRDDAVISAVVYASQDLTLNDRSRLYGRVWAAHDLYVYGDSELCADTSQPSFGPAQAPAGDCVGGFDGAYRGGVTGGQAGCGDGGTSVLFNGSSGYVLIPHSNTLLLNQGAVSLWFYSSNLSGQHGLFSKAASGYATGGLFNLFTTGNHVAATLQSATATYTVTAPTNLVTNTWYHVAVTFGAGGLRIYLNGALAASNSYVGGLGSSSGGAGNCEPLIMGADASGSTTLTASPLSGYFAGRLDDVRVYNRDLDRAQVAHLAARQPIGNKSSPSQVVLDTSASAGEPLTVYIPDTSKVAWQTGGGLQITAATRLASPVAAPKLAQLLSANGQMSLEVIFTPANTTQSGPAQVLSHSATLGTSNFCFGQDTQRYVGRIRTSGTSSSAAPDVASPQVLTPGGAQQVIVVFDGQAMKLYRNRVLEGTSTRAGNFSTWAGAYRLILANEETVDRPWLGTLQRIAIYDRAFNAAQLAHVFADQPPGDGTDQQRLSVQWDEQP